MFQLSGVHYKGFPFFGEGLGTWGAEISGMSGGFLGFSRGLQRASWGLRGLRMSKPYALNP